MKLFVALEDEWHWVLKEDAGHQAVDGVDAEVTGAEVKLVFKVIDVEMRGTQALLFKLEDGFLFGPSNLRVRVKIDVLEDTQREECTGGWLKLIEVVLLALGLWNMLLGCTNRRLRAVELDVTEHIDELFGQVVHQKKLLHLFLVRFCLYFSDELLW